MTHSRADVNLRDERLIELWHSEQPAGPIAVELGISARELQDEWARLKFEGRLPRVQRHRSNMGRPAAAELTDKFDGRPSTLDDRYEDKLLEALRFAHPEGPRYDYYPGMRRRQLARQFGPSRK